MRRFILASMLCVGSVSSGLAQSPQPERPPANTPTTIKLEQGASGDYWTEARRRNAQPLEAPKLSKDDLDRLRKEEVPEQLSSRDFSAALAAPVRANVGVSPYAHAGHLYFTRDGLDLMCTAQFVGESVLLTAAHCLQNGTTGAFSTNVVFYRAYDNGSVQQQVQTVCPAVFIGWKTETGYDKMKWDYAFLKTATPSTSGHFGLYINLPNTSWEAIGYPQNFGANVVMQKVSGTKGVVYRGRVEMVGNPMRKGSSGGAWHVNGNAIGNNSFDVADDPNTMWSPYYDSNTLFLWQYANRGCQ